MKSQASEILKAKPAKKVAGVKKSKPLPSVALLIETTRSYGRNLLRGINDYGSDSRAMVISSAQ